ncbi:MAG TPA: 50S ribosomal protein L21 [Candidatus Limnocylindrales bacterium]|jgi:large subunit ribosomal protein L21
MYAVIETGGKQYRVEVGTELEVELLEVGPGDAIKLDRVLLVADGDNATIGRPLVENASVDAEVLRRARGDKLINFKYGPKTRRRVKKGHRQELTVLRISDIVLDGRSAAADAKKAAEAKITERQRLEEAARRQAEADAALAAKLKPATPPAAPKAARPTKADKADAVEKPAKPASKSTAAKSAAAKPTAAKSTAAEAPPKATAAKRQATKTTKAPAKAAPPDAAAPADKPKRPRATKKDA